MKTKLLIDNYDAVEEAAMNCLQDMYAIAQPPLDFKAYCEKIKNDPELAKQRIWDKHYLPEKVHKELIDLYLCRYHLKNTWDRHAEMCIEYLDKGGSRDKYIEEHTDEYGNYHPGYRGYEKVKPIAEEIGQEAADKVLEHLNYCKEFYVGNRNECSFRFSICNYSPSSNARAVEAKQHELGNADFKANEKFDPWGEDEEEDYDYDTID